MTNKKLSSIDWLLQEALQWNVDRTDNSQFIQFPSGAIEQAKAMHKEEITNAHTHGRNVERGMDDGVYTSFEYYNETFGGNYEQQ